MSDLEQYRQEIDELDEQLVRLFLRRMEVTGKVGEYKLAHGMQVLDRERERRVLAKRASLAVDIRQEEDVKELFQTIMAISRRRQQELIDRSGISKATLARCSGMSEIYVHQILSGRRSPSRGRLICLCYGLGATLDETQELLKLYGLAQLYPRNRRDAILIYGLTHNVSVQDINDRLFAEDEETLY